MREGLIDKVTFEQRPEEVMGQAIQRCGRKIISTRGNNKCKCPEAGVYLMCSYISNMSLLT
jgi:hypothetical protein